MFSEYPAGQCSRCACLTGRQTGCCLPGMPCRVWVHAAVDAVTVHRWQCQTLARAFATHHSQRRTPPPRPRAPQTACGTSPAVRRRRQQPGNSPFMWCTHLYPVPRCPTGSNAQPQHPIPRSSCWKQCSTTASHPSQQSGRRARAPLPWRPATCRAMRLSSHRLAAATVAAAPSRMAASVSGSLSANACSSPCMVLTWPCRAAIRSISCVRSACRAHAQRERVY